jgi:acetoacetyl-CoA synthetase
MRTGHRFTPELVSNIRAAIKNSLSARHVPAYIFEVRDIPVSVQYYFLSSWELTMSPQYTVNNKKIEIAVKQIVSGSNLMPSGTVANPESLDNYYKFRNIENIVEDEQRESKL